MMSADTIQLTIDAALEGAVAIGALHALGVQPGPASPSLAAALDAAVASPPPEAASEETRRAVRGLLRHGSYRPTGRGKPASEYLLAAAREGAFPRIGNLVDINNLVSLESGLPASIVDVALAGARAFHVRRGRDGESYVFNAAGQRIELTDLLLVATQPDDRPVANPVKDALASKVVASTSEVLVVIYAPPSCRAALERSLGRYARLLREEASAAAVREMLL